MPEPKLPPKWHGGEYSAQQIALLRERLQRDRVHGAEKPAVTWLLEEIDWLNELLAAERDLHEALVTQAQDYARGEAERADRLVTLARDMFGRFCQVSDGYRARVGQVQIGKWETALAQLEDAAGEDLT
jgi:hypothetical protein